MKFFIMPNLDKDNTVSAVADIRRAFPSDANKLMYQKKYSPELAQYGDLFDDDVASLVNQADAVIAIGGDGTIIHTAKIAAEAGKPVIGVNSGYLGFTAEIEYDEIKLLEMISSGNYVTEKRMMLEVCVFSADNEEKFRCNAINDAVISRGALNRLLSINVAANGLPALGYRADGLIISTPTGSTAYALSAGGPIISPQINCIPVTPISPHDLNSRTVIFGDDSVLNITAGGRQESDFSGNTTEKAFLVVDGELLCEISKSDRVEIRKSPISAMFIKLKNSGFSEKLKSKLKY